MKISSMNILVLEPLPSSYHGGQSLSTFEVSQGLSKRGYEVSLLALGEGDLIDRYREFCQQILNFPPQRLQREILLRSGFRMLTDLAQVILQWKRSFKQPSIIYLSNHECALFGVLLSKILRLPVVLHIRTAITPVMIFHQQDRWSIRQIDHYIAVSEHVAGEWSKEFSLKPDRLTVIYNGVDLDRFQPTQEPSAAREILKLPTEGKLIGYIGRLSPDKGLEVLFQAFAQLLTAIQEPVYLAIAGEPSGFATAKQGQAYKKHLYQLCEELNLKQTVIFLGHLSNPQVLFQASDVTVLPSTYPEPFGRSIIESMACATPVLASQVGGIPTIFGSTLSDLTFLPKNPKSLHQKLIDFIDWRNQRPLLGNQCRVHIFQQFSSIQTLDKIELTLKSQF
jgi:glycosyltransferase involved in cell wall biosynthesis